MSVGVGEVTYPTRNSVGAISSIPLISTIARADWVSGQNTTLIECFVEGRFYRRKMNKSVEQGYKRGI